MAIELSFFCFNHLSNYCHSIISLLISFINRFYQMKLSTTVIAIGLFALAQAQFHPSQFRSGASGFVPSVQQQQESEEDDRIADSTPAAAVNYRQQSYEYEEDDEEARQPTQPPQIRRQQYLRPNNYAPQPAKQASNTKNQFEDELEVEEPDRLALFLEKSTFQCEGRTGYMNNIKFIKNFKT